MSEQTGYRGSLRQDLSGSWGWIVVGILLFSVFVYIGYRFLLSILFGFFIYYGTRPIYRWLNNKMGGRKSALISVILVGIPMLVVFGMVVFAGYQQTAEILTRNNVSVSGLIPERTEFRQLAELFTVGLKQSIQEEGVIDMVRQYGTLVSSVADPFFRAVFSVFLSFVFAFFIFVWGPDLRTDILEIFGKDEKVLESFLGEVDKNLSTLFFGNIVNMLITATLATVSYLVMNLFSPASIAIPSAVTIGLAAGLASLIPVIGPKIVYFPVAIFMFFRTFVSGAGVPGYIFSGVFLLISMFLVDGFPDMVIRPIISGRNINQGALFVSYLLGPIIFGFVGFFLLPVIVIIYISFHRKVLPGFKKTPD